MMSALQKKMKDAYNDYYGTESHQTERKVWVMSNEHPGQAISTIGQITWTESTEMAINDLTDEANQYAVEDHLLLLKQQLRDLTDLIRNNLTFIRRRILVALIT